ncbi:MAG: hypothetical protein RIE53_00695 [Rhodothermales bacterium]
MPDPAGSYELILLEKGLWHVKYHGPISLETRKAALESFLADMGDNIPWGMLIDLRDADMHLTLHDAFAWGNRLAAEIHFHGCRMVFLEAPENAERSTFVETVSRNRGGTTRVMTDWDDAMAWLREGPR